VCFCIGEEFRSRLDAIMTQALRKGVPPLFNNLRSLYCDKDKVQIASNVFAEIVLNNCSSFTLFVVLCREGLFDRGAVVQVVGTN